MDDTPTLVAWTGMWALIGLAAGSFLNVVIWRLPRRLSLVSPPSRCPGCGSAIRVRDNVPVLAWVLLRGRCRDCGTSISARYPLVELGTGVLFAAAAVRFENRWALPAFLLLFATLLAIALIDLEHYIVPNRIVFPVAVASLVLLGAAAVLDGDGGAWVRAFLGGAAAFGGLLVVHLASPRGMGMGDVKLAFLLGVDLGWLSWGHVALVGGALVVFGGRTRKQQITFAPFLAAGTVLAVLWGVPILDWYGAR